MIVGLLVAGAAAIALGAALLPGLPAARRVALRLSALGSAAVGVSGLWVFATGQTLGAGFASGLSPRFGVDALSGFFLGMLGLVAALAFLHSERYLPQTGAGRTIAALTAGFVLVMAEVVCARDPLTFLGGWELMTMVPALIILVARRADREARRTVFVYAAVTHLGGVGTWIAVLLLASAGALGDPSAIQSGSTLQVVICVAALVGMGTKAGLMPFHVWLPRAHPIAPAPVSALMSGVMIKIAVYALVRVLVDWVGVVPVWFGVLVFGLGAVSAVGGVVYALFAHDLKRLLALHSIENIGIIVLGLGACLTLRAQGDTRFAAFALAAALLHTLNHAVFKSGLFLGAGSFERMVGSLEIDHLGGLLRRMPVTGVAFLIAAMAIAGLPPLNGFASEWLTLQALLHVPMSGGVGAGTAGAVALAALAATASLAVLCFVKVVGLVLLGPARRHAVAEATDAPAQMRVAVATLAGVCVILGLAPGLLFGRLVGLAPWAAPQPATIGLDVPGTGGLPTLGIGIVVAGAAAVLALTRGRRQASPAPTWACGQRLSPELLWTSAGFTKSLRLVMESVLRPRREISMTTDAGVVQSVSYSGAVPHLIDERVYQPAERLSLRAAHHARKLQGGSLGRYVSGLIVVVLALLLAARFGVLG